MDAAEGWRPLPPLLLMRERGAYSPLLAESSARQSSTERESERLLRAPRPLALFTLFISFFDRGHPHTEAPKCVHPCV